MTLEQLLAQVPEDRNWRLSKTNMGYQFVLTINTGPIYERTSEYGSGRTPSEAITNALNKLKGET